jgi:LL-diaminopimelate aminotransferase
MYEYNQNFFKDTQGYLFAVQGEKIEKYRRTHPNADLISLGIGDVTLPLAPVIVQALVKASEDMGNAQLFHGYGPYAGYEWLRSDIIEHDFKSRGVSLDLDEIFVSDGAKSDCGNLCELFSASNRIAVCDPTYPAYIGANILYGRGGTFDMQKDVWDDIVYLPCTAENAFVPELPEKTADIIYLCFPNNPTGVMISKERLQRWVDYAVKNRALIIYDAAYEAYITDTDAVHSVYECEGAKECAVEIRSYSKVAGFTGMRMGYIVIPKTVRNEQGSLNALWGRRLGVKYNGAPYVIQRAAQAVYSSEGHNQVMEQIAYYMNNVRYIVQELKKLGYTVYGGKNSPYAWLQTPHGMSSWDFFDYLLDKAHVIGTPGSGFGPSGRGYFRLTGFGSYENTVKAVDRIRKYIG